MERVAVIDAAGPAAFQAARIAARPVVLKGLVRDWPSVAAARAGCRALADYLARFATAEPLAFAVHVGDFKSGYSECGDALYQQRKEWFNLSRHPFVLVPGDTTADAQLLLLRRRLMPRPARGGGSGR